MMFIIRYRGKERDEEDNITTTLTLFEGSSETRFEKSEGYFQNCSLARNYRVSLIHEFNLRSL